MLFLVYKYSKLKILEQYKLKLTKETE